MWVGSLPCSTQFVYINHTGVNTNKKLGSSDNLETWVTYCVFVKCLLEEI